MSIPAAAKHTPISGAQADISYLQEGGAFSPRGLSQQDAVRNYVNGGGRIFACMATGTNVITLTPNGHGDEDGVSPLLEGYKFGDAFLFWAAETSTGSVTATIVPKSGALDTLKVYKTAGSAQAGAGDTVQNSVYFLVYAPHLDSNAGGFVLK